MKQLLRLLLSNLLACFTLCAFSQQNHEVFSTPGTAYWTCPLGVTSVTVNMWGAGGYGGYKYSGAGGNFTRSASIPVIPGQTYTLKIGQCMLFAGDQDPNSYFPTGNNTYIRANGAFYQDGGSYDPAGFTQNPYVAVQYRGGYGVNENFNSGNLSNTPSGGGGAASSCGNGYNGYYGGNGGGSPNNCSGAIVGGGGGNPYNNGSSPGGGGGGTGYFTNGQATIGGNGRIEIWYTCTTSTPGEIGNGHTVVYPPQMVPDNITNVTNPLAVSGMTIKWQQSTDNVNWVDAKTPTNALSYRFDQDNVQTTTYYRRGNNAICTPGNQYGNWSNSVRIQVFTDGANGKVTGYVLSKNFSPVKQRKVYAKSLTPLKGRPVGYLDSALTDDQGYFNIDNIFYGSVYDGDSANVRFRVYADTMGRHTYTPVYSDVTLTRTSNTYDLGKPAFRDLSTMTIAGQVTQTCADCLLADNTVGRVVAPLDSVKVMGVGAVIQMKDSSFTGYKNPPGTYGNFTLVFGDQDTYKVTPTYKNHKIIPKDTTVVLNGGDVGSVNFSDTTTHLITGFFGAGCGDVIGTATLEFSDSLPMGHDGQPQKSVLRKRVTTKANGSYSIRLPARAYTVKIISNSIKVNDPYDQSTTASSISKWFNAIRKDSTKTDSFYRDITTHDTVLNLIYQRAPQIVVDGLRNDSMLVSTCPAFKNYNFWPQGIRRPVYFKVYQGPASRGCLTDTGRVTIKTDISINQGQYNYDTVPVSRGIAIDSIVAAQPNRNINPVTGTYSKTLTAKYTDIIDRGFSTDTSKPALPIVVVTGASIDPSGTNFVTVSPQIPMMVLHDPPGNKSYSVWSKDVSNSTKLSFAAKGALTEGAYVKAKIGLSQIVGMFVLVDITAGIGIDAEFSTTQTITNTDEAIITNTSRTELKTSDDPAYIGRDADIVYGQALNINYKEGIALDWDSARCIIVDPYPIMVSDIKRDATTYAYTVGLIRDEEIPRLERAAIASKNADSAAYFRNQEGVWQQLLDQLDANNKLAPVIMNRSIGNGAEVSESQTFTNERSNTFAFDLEIENKFAIDMGFEIAGNGITAGARVNFKVNTGWDNTTTNSTATTIGYTLKDDQPGVAGSYSGNKLSVNIKKDPVYGTPMFETVAGSTQCPHQEGTISLYQPLITAPVTEQTGVTGNAVNYLLYLNNNSPDATPNGKRTYELFLNPSSNPDGATVNIGGDPAPKIFPIANNGGQQQVTVTVMRNTAGGVYNYDNLEFIMTDPCFGGYSKFYDNPHEYSTIKLSTDFAAPVSGVTLVTPVSNWVSNKANNDSVKVTFNGYDTSRLASIAVQYNLPGDPNGNWVTITTIAKAKLGKTSTTYYWKTGKLPDGPYNLRLMVKDKLNNIVYSTVAPGLIDRIAPSLFGVPQPSNGSYIAGTQLSYSYNENINTTNLGNYMVSMTDLTANTTTPVQLSAFGNTLIVTPLSSIVANTGHLYRVIARNVSDVYGNVKTTPDTAYFTVATTTFGTGSDALNMTSTPSSMYEDAKGFFRVQFTRNTKATDTLVVYYNLSGNAVYNKDYTVAYNSKGQSSATGINGAKGQILMPKDSSKVEMYIYPVNDSMGMQDKMLNITLSQGGTYTLGSNYTVSDTIRNHNTTSPVITANKSTTLCSGDSVTLKTANKINGVAVKSYLWSTGAKTQSIKVKTSGSYTVRVTDANGLIGYSAPTVVTFTCGNPANLIANVLSATSAVLSWDAQSCAVRYNVQYRKVGTTKWKSDTVNVARDTIKGLVANTSYQWQVSTICRYPSIIMSGYTAGTNFKTQVAPGAIMVASASDYSRASAGDGFAASVFPNPASSSAMVEVKGARGPFNVLLTDMQGVVLWKADGITTRLVKLPLAKLSAGIYMVVVKDAVHSGTLKLVKQ